MKKSVKFGVFADLHVDIMPDPQRRLEAFFAACRKENVDFMPIAEEWMKQTRLILEFDERKTKEAIFAYHCDKLECDIQCKLYDEEKCVDMNKQQNNKIY